MPNWAVHHPDGSWSCRDCGRSSRSLDGVRGHRRSCPGRAGLEANLGAIRTRNQTPVPIVAQADANSSHLSGSQPTAQSAAQSAVQPLGASREPRYRPYAAQLSPAELAQRDAAQAVQEECPGCADLRRQLQLRDERIDQLSQDVAYVAEVTTNSLGHLGQGQESGTPWYVYAGGAVAVLGGLAWAAGLFGGDPEPEPVNLGRARVVPSKSNGENKTMKDVGDVLSVGSKLMGLVKNTRGAFKF